MLVMKLALKSINLGLKHNSLSTTHQGFIVQASSPVPARTALCSCQKATSLESFLAKDVLTPGFVR